VRPENERFVQSFDSITPKGGLLLAPNKIIVCSGPAPAKETYPVYPAEGLHVSAKRPNVPAPISTSKGEVALGSLVLFIQVVKEFMVVKQLSRVTVPSWHVLCNRTTDALLSMTANTLDEKKREISNATAGKIRNDFMSPPILGEFDEDCWCDDRMILLEIPAEESLSTGRIGGQEWFQNGPRLEESGFSYYSVSRR
jgi:hypothetical protein